MKCYGTIFIIFCLCLWIRSFSKCLFITYNVFGIMKVLKSTSQLIESIFCLVIICQILVFSDYTMDLTYEQVNM